MPSSGVSRGLGVEVGGSVVMSSEWQSQQQNLADIVGKQAAAGRGGKIAGTKTFMEFMEEDMKAVGEAAVQELSNRFTETVLYRGTTAPTGKLQDAIRLTGPRREETVSIPGMGKGTSIYMGIFDLDIANRCVPTGGDVHSAGIKYWEIFEEGIRKPFKLTKRQVAWFKWWLRTQGSEMGFEYVPGLKDRRDWKLPGSRTGKSLTKQQKSSRTRLINKMHKAGKLFIADRRTTRFGAASGWHPGFPGRHIFRDTFIRFDAALQNVLSTSMQRYRDSWTNKLPSRYLDRPKTESAKMRMSSKMKQKMADGAAKAMRRG